jgi:hypothetical protein
VGNSRRCQATACVVDLEEESKYESAMRLGDFLGNTDHLSIHIWGEIPLGGGLPAAGRDHIYIYISIYPYIHIINYMRVNG